MASILANKRVADIIKAYSVTSTSVWSIKVFGYGITVMQEDALTFEACRKIYIAQDNFTSQSVVAFVDSQRLPYYIAQKLFYGGHKELNPCHDFLTRGAGLE